jgi:hypothetical protein
MIENTTMSEFIGPNKILMFVTMVGLAGIFLGHLLIFKGPRWAGLFFLGSFLLGNAVEKALALFSNFPHFPVVFEWLAPMNLLPGLYWFLILFLALFLSEGITNRKIEAEEGRFWPTLFLTGLVSAGLGCFLMPLCWDLHILVADSNSPLVVNHLLWLSLVEYGGMALPFFLVLSLTGRKKWHILATFSILLLSLLPMSAAILAALWEMHNLLTLWVKVA